MSTRKTISISERMHLFEELSDGSFYLELEEDTITLIPTDKSISLNIE